MRKILAVMAILTTAATFVACEKEKKQTVNNIIVPPREEKVPDTLIHQMNEIDHVDEVKWVGSTYKVRVHRYSSDSLSVATDENGKRYYNNLIRVHITRADGSVFFDKLFSKKMFEGFVDDKYLSQNLILGMVYNGNDANNLYFLGSVGCPDILTEEYVPFNVSVNRVGEVKVEKASLEAVENDSTLVSDGV
ncbi:MAG: DUF4738 domain-containing protein [Prevotella sp.]|nr:DUF4738 domain-containing protein [Prevotella sp.]